MIDLEARLVRAGVLLDEASESAPFAPEVPKPVRRFRLAVVASLVVLVVVASLIAARDDSATTVAGPGSSAEDTGYIRVDVVVSDGVGPAEFELLDPIFEVIPTSGIYQIGIAVTGEGTERSEATLGRWRALPSGPSVTAGVGNQQGGCEGGAPICNVDGAFLIRNDGRVILPLYFDSGSLDVGTLVLEADLELQTGVLLSVGVRLSVAPAAPSPTHATYTTNIPPPSG